MRRYGRTTRLLLVLLAFFLVAGIGCASAATIYVPDTYGTIQQAVDNARAGDTIIVRDGTYRENVKVNVAHLTIQAQQGPANCIVQAANLHDHVVEVTADYVTIRGFTVTGAMAIWTGDRTLFWVGIQLGSRVDHCIIANNTLTNNSIGIALNYSSSNTIAGNTISNNKWYGISISPYGRSSSSNANTITGNTISNNNFSGIDMWYSTNTFINGNTISNNDPGIDMHVCADTIINGNTISNNEQCGIYIFTSTNTAITSNNVSNNKLDGIDILDHSSTTITSNAISNNKLDGIALYSSGSVITNNTISNNANYGIKSSSDTIITNNTISNNAESGIKLYQSRNNTITGNTFLQDGLSVDHVGPYKNKNTIANNTVNGKPLVYLENATDQRVTGAGQVVLANCAAIIIEQSQITNTEVGIDLWESVDCVITNNTISNNAWDGIRLYSSTNNTITNNTVSNNMWNGISLDVSTNNTITSNVASTNRDDGISLTSSFNNTIIGNTVSNNGNFGIHEVYRYEEESRTNAIINNTISSNRVDYKRDKACPPPTEPCKQPSKYFVGTSDSSASESGDTATIYFGRELPPGCCADGWEKMHYSIGGTATNGIDYEYLSGEVYVLIGSAVFTPPTDAPREKIIIKPIPDMIPEGNETVVITFGGSSATVTIANSNLTPVFTALVALVGLAAAAYCARKRKS